MPHPMSHPSFAQSGDVSPRLGAHERAAVLLSRYPHLSRPQIDNLAGLVPKLSALDLSLMMSDDNLAPRLEAFYAAHGDKVSPSMSDYLVIAAILAFPVVVLLALVLAGQ